jgi:hypothetical protein
MIRNNDESGISGTGVILEGAIFSDGHCITYWLGKDFNSFNIHKHFYAFYFIHVKSQPTNKTQIIFNEEVPIPVPKERREKCRHCGNAYKTHPQDLQWEDTKRVRSCSGNLVELN